MSIFVHRFREDGLSQFSCFCGSDWRFKENPNMCTVTGARTFYIARNFPFFANTNKCKNIILKAVFATLIIEVCT